MNSMTPISGPIPRAAAAVMRETPKVQCPETRAPAPPQKPMMDEYAPEDKREPSGLYWPGRDENGQPKIYFDDPERAADRPRRPDERPDSSGPEQADGPEKKAPSRKAERCIGSTDQVDREIERLKRKRERLEQQISAETDDAKRSSLEQKLAQVERELSRKDNDTYRRQHTVFS